MREELGDLQAFAEAVRDEGVTDVVLLGMGGSSLAPEVIRRSFGEQGGWPSLHVLDSTDAGAMRSVEEAIDLDHALFLVSTKSGGTIETLSLFKHFWSRRSDGNAFVAITDPGSGLEKLAERARLPAHLPQRPRHRRALQRAVVLRPGPRGAHGRRRGRAAARRRRGRAQLPELRVRRRVERAVAGARVGRAGGRRPRQADLRHRPAAAVLRALGRAAHRRVDRQAGQGHPARGRRAGGRPRRLRPGPHLPAPAQRRAPRRGDRRQGRGAARGRPPGDRARDRRPRRPRADLLLRRVRDRHGRLGAGHQPVRPAQRAGGQGRDQPRAGRRRRGPARRHRRRAARAARRPRRAELPGGHGLRRALRRLRRRGERAAPDGPRRHEVRDDVRLRPALPALDRPAAQGRPAHRALPAARPRLGARRRDPRARTTASRA